MSTPLRLTRRHALHALAAALTGCVTAPAPEPAPTSTPETLPTRSIVHLGELVLVAPNGAADAFVGGPTLRTAVARVHDVAHRLRARSHGLCGTQRAPQYGFVAGNLAAVQALVPAPEAAAPEADEPLSVWHVAEGSPAAVAGLREGDVIERVGESDLPAGTAALEALRTALGRAGGLQQGVDFRVRRGAGSLNLRLQSVQGCDIPAVLASDRTLAWAGGELPLAEAPDALLAHTLAHGTALRLGGPRRGLAVGAGDIGEGIDFTLSMFSLALGLVTLGGWPAKEVNIFRGSGGGRAEAEARLRDEADLAADALALRMLHQAGFDAVPLFAVWLATVDRTGQAGMRHRLERMREQWRGFVAGNGAR